MSNVFPTILRIYEMDNSARVILTKVCTVSQRCSDRNQKEEYRKNIERNKTAINARHQTIREKQRYHGVSRSSANSQAGTELRFPDKQKRSRREAPLIERANRCRGTRGARRKTRGIRYQVSGRGDAEEGEKKRNRRSREKYRGLISHRRPEERAVIRSLAFLHLQWAILGLQSRTRGMRVDACEFPPFSFPRNAQDPVRHEEKEGKKDGVDSFRLSPPLDPGKLAFRRASFSHPRLQILKLFVRRALRYETYGCDTKCLLREQTNELHTAVSRSITRVKWHKRWCMRRQMTAYVPHQRAITAVSLARSRASALLVTSSFVHLPPSSSLTASYTSWFLWPPATTSNLETNHSGPHRRRYVVVDRRREFLGDKCGYKSRGTNTEWRRSRIIGMMLLLASQARAVDAREEFCAV